MVLLFILILSITLSSVILFLIQPFQSLLKFSIHLIVLRLTLNTVGWMTDVEIQGKLLLEFTNLPVFTIYAT
jgi:hypothetical protein